MDAITNNLLNKQWQSVKKCITNNKIDWDWLVDQCNGTLHYLAYHDKFDLIKAIDPAIMADIVTQPNIEGDTICHIAAKMNNPALFLYTIDTDPMILYKKNNLHCTPLFYFVSNYKFITNIVSYINLADHSISNEYRLLEYYVIAGQLDMVTTILANVKMNNQSNIAIFTAIASDRDVSTKLIILQLLKKYAFDFNFRNAKFLTPLIVAIYYGQYDIIKFILNCGINLNYYGPENTFHPLSLAIKSSNIPLIKLLIRAGIDTKCVDKYLKTPLHYLFSKPNNIPAKLKAILIDSSNINLVDNKMNSILNLLIHNDDWTKYISILTQSKLKIYLANKSGIRPIDGVKIGSIDHFYSVVYQSYLYQLKANAIWVDDTDTIIAHSSRENVQEHKSYIISKIIHGQSYPLRKNNGPMLKLILPPKTNITHYTAYTYNYICFLYYILDKYPNVKIPYLSECQRQERQIPALQSDANDTIRSFYKKITAGHPAIIRSILRDYINHSPILVNHIIIWKSPDMYFVSPLMFQGIKTILIKYPSTQYILIKLTIILNNNSNHANMLIYDIEANCVERFDPYGVTVYYNNAQIDSFLRSTLQNHIPNVIYLSSSETAGSLSFQAFSDENNRSNYVENDSKGFCVAWCIFYVEMRINNPSIKPSSLIKKTIYQINKNENRIKDYIRNYSDYLDSEKNNIFEKASVPKKYWYTLNLPNHIYKSYLKYIRNAYNSLF